MSTHREYLGDSVYVEIEDGMIKLTTNNGLGPSNTIYLELQVYNALLAYVRKIEALAAYVAKIKEERAQRKSGGEK